MESHFLDNTAQDKTRRDKTIRVFQTFLEKPALNETKTFIYFSIQRNFFFSFFNDQRLAVYLSDQYLGDRTERYLRSLANP